jgi:2-polyprenyl-3-methyl-5-hydroxy-6-metoxy-1,4-benzoquinol methylase
MGTKTAGNLGRVHDFWNVEACGSQFVGERQDLQEFYARFREHRSRTLWFIPDLVPFSAARDKDVLEIGCGNGADGAAFALQGARYTGVDLTQTAVEATRKHFEVLGLTGSFRTENAEALSFADGSFDIVYSYGVLHHTPDPRRAIAEVHRVLRPDGQAIVMLYHKNSFNHYVRILGYMRLRLVLKILSRSGCWRQDRVRMARQSNLEMRGNQNPRLWEAHYKNFLETGWSYLAADRFVHHCTDGPECPIAHVFDRGSARRTFSMFRQVEMKVAHLPLRQYLGGWVPFGLERELAARIGWALMIYAMK